MTQETLTTLFGWMTVLNFGFLLLTSIGLLALRDWVTGVHARMFDMEPADVRAAYFRYLANFKTLWLFFCLVPWLALKLV
ncbi:DUF6868 family protein [Primorskyibacter sp. S87]|uniref:DUF6868 family protein n=1 Tax=Primorskyibacter sp. S87 TaxID=3415126 RepID=UPI003C7C1C5E